MTLQRELDADSPDTRRSGELGETKDRMRTNEAPESAQPTEKHELSLGELDRRGRL